MLCTLTSCGQWFAFIVTNIVLQYIWYMSSKQLLKCNNLAELGESKCLSHWLSNVEASGQWQWEVNVSFYHICTAINFLMRVSTRAFSVRQGCLIWCFSWLNTRNSKVSMWTSPSLGWVAGRPNVNWTSNSVGKAGWGPDWASMLMSPTMYNMENWMHRSWAHYKLFNFCFMHYAWLEKSCWKWMDQWLNTCKLKKDWLMLLSFSP